MTGKFGLPIHLLLESGGRITSWCRSLEVSGNYVKTSTDRNILQRFGVLSFSLTSG